MKLVDIVILFILAGLVALAIRYIVKRRKSGRPIGCAGNCENCALNCTRKEIEREKKNEQKEK